MRFIPALAVAAALACTTAQAATITDSSATVGLFFGDIYADATAPVSSGPALTYASLSGGTGYAPMFAVSLENGSDQLLFAETDDWSFAGGNTLSFLFDLADSSAFGDWLRVTFTLAETVADPFGFDTAVTTSAQMTITSGSDIPAVPVPAALPLMLGALAMGAGLAARRKG